MMNRSSVSEYSGSGMVDESGSLNMVAASSNVTPCLRRLVLALAGSHSTVAFIIARFLLLLRLSFAVSRLEQLGGSQVHPPGESDV